MDRKLLRDEWQRIHEFLRRHLIEALPDVFANHELTEYPQGGIVLKSKKTGEVYLIRSSSAGFYSWGKGNVMTEQQFAEEIQKRLKA